MIFDLPPESFSTVSANCSMVKDGEILYRDGDHLNANGSLYVGRQLVMDDAFKMVFKTSQ